MSKYKTKSGRGWSPSCRGGLGLGLEVESAFGLELFCKADYGDHYQRSFQVYFAFENVTKNLRMSLLVYKLNFYIGKKRSVCVKF